MRQWRLATVLVAVFVASRLVYFALGVRIDTGSLASAIQFLPRRFLEHDLVRSLWYLHAQPPAFNAFLGAVLHLPGNAGWFVWCYLTMGLALTLTMFALMVELGVPPRVACIVTALFIVSPTTVLYENWLIYTYPVALLLCCTTLFGARYLRAHRPVYAAAFASSVAVLALIRASYHLVFVVAALGFLVLASPRVLRTRTLALVAIPFVVVAGVYVKNEVVFGEPGASSWFGMNLAHMMFLGDPPGLQADIAAGRLSHQATIPPFSALRVYGVTARHAGVPALDDAIVDGHSNYNALGYIEVSDRYQRDVVRYLRDHPGVYVRRVVGSYRTAFASAADYKAFRHNRPHIAWLVSLQNRLLGQVDDLVPPAPSPVTPGWDRIAWLVVVQYLAVAGGAVVLAVRVLRRRPLSTRAMSFLVGAAMVVYSVLASNLLEYGDNNRFRFETDPLVCVLATALVVRWLTTRATQRRIAAVIDVRDAGEQLGAERVGVG